MKGNIHTPCPICREKFSSPRCEHSYWYVKKVVSAALGNRHDLQFHKDVAKVAKGMNK
jgi:hypothetical protein